MYTLFYVTQKKYFEFIVPNLLPYKALNRRPKFPSSLLKKNYNVPDLLNVYYRSFCVSYESFLMKLK
jgi:hypothetical protein